MKYVPHHTDHIIQYEPHKMRPLVYLDFSNYLLIQFLPTGHRIQQVLQVHTYMWGLILNSTGVCCICNCIFHRSSSILRFSYVCGLPLCWCWQFFIILRQKSSASAQRQATNKERSHSAAISVEDAIIIIRGLNLCGGHCTIFSWADSEGVGVPLLACKFLFTQYTCLKLVDFGCKLIL
jgi:hypothetical protein